MPNDIQLLDLATRLRALAQGSVEWRVQHPVERCYCMTFSRQNSRDPERDARDWLADHKRRFPDSRQAGFEVAEVRVYDELQQVAQEAAEALEKIAVRAAASMGGREG